MIRAYNLAMTSESSLSQQIAHLRACSPYSSHLLDIAPYLQNALEQSLHQPWSETEMRNILEQIPITDEASLKKRLRNLRKQVLLRLITRDLNGLADLQEVMETCTMLAELVVNHALEWLHPWAQSLYGIPLNETGEAQSLVVVGMGKLGGRELNVSSDIDLIFAYPHEGQTDGDRTITNHEYFSRLGKKLIAVIGEVTEDGFVFRVDMRLRPYGDSGPLVGSLSALENYYQTQGREWERYAWIKGRVIAGPSHEIESLLKPFIYRKYMDYSGFASIRDLKSQIRREVAKRDMYDNIKLGPGGIREVEFIAQVFQLIRGGRLPELQIRPTLQVLSILRKLGLLDTQTVDELVSAYAFLRNLEHRIQYLHDAQSQSLPADETDKARLALGMGFTDWAALLEALQQHRQNVKRHFASVFADMVQEDHPLGSLWHGTCSEEETQFKLESLGYSDKTEPLLRQLYGSTRYNQLPAASRERFDTIMPRIIVAAAKRDHPDETLFRTINLLEAICRRATYLALLSEYPATLELVVKLCASGAWLAHYLTQHPILLDELLDARNLYATPDFAEMRESLERTLVSCGEDTERKLDTLRHYKHAQTLRFAAQDLAHEMPVETLSDYLSSLADLLLDAVIRHAWPGLRRRHCDSPAFAIIGYGKLGGRELGYASDLDLVFLYDDDHPEAAEIYARFGQRISSWLNNLTPAGQLYEIDLRLRPDGASGLLVSSVQAFAEYQRGKAWLWEHQALTRARFCAGDINVGQQFETLRHEILVQPRNPDIVKTNVIEMRQKMHEGHPNHSLLFDIKQDAGGIVDVEFMVQYLILHYAHDCPALTGNLGNLALLKMAGNLGLIETHLAEKVADAYSQFRHEQHIQGLQGAHRALVDPTLFSSQRIAVKQLWQNLFDV